jgi:hypothetical protein
MEEQPSSQARLLDPQSRGESLFVRLPKELFAARPSESATEIRVMQVKLLFLSVATSKGTD